MSAGFEVRTVSNGAEALRQLRDEVPDLVVLDLMLPWVNGVEVLATLREQPDLTKLPVLVTTATATQESDLRPFQPLTILRKPIDLDTIVPAIELLLTRRVMLDTTGSDLPSERSKL